MPSNIEQAIIKTVVYSDIFGYPLTREEIGKWLIKVKSGKLEVKSEVKKLKIVQEKDGCYYLKKRESIVAERIKREKYSRGKLKIAKRIANLLKIIPTVKLVGITGALSMDNAKKDDDIDLFIITSSGLLWTTRLLVTLLVEIAGMRRHPQETNADNKICLNMFMAEGYLEIPKDERDLFSAHEVLQMKLLWDRDNTYQEFLFANQWTKKYLPNVVKSSKYQVVSSGYRQKKDNPLEKILKEFQLRYMRNRRTTEIIKDGIIRFHPRDAREWIMKRYNQKLKNIGKLPS